MNEDQRTLRGLLTGCLPDELDAISRILLSNPQQFEVELLLTIQEKQRREEYELY